MQRAPHGFTLVELMVGVTIIASMALLAMPSMTAFLQNAKLGSAAKSYEAGLQTARTEAIRRNLPVEFLLTDTAISSATTATSSVTGKNWVVRVSTPDPDPLVTAPVVSLVEAKSALEGSAQAAGTTSTIGVTATAGSIIFNGFGGTADGSQQQLFITNIAGGACSPNGPMRCLDVVVKPGGQIMVCDPVATGSDSRRC